MRRGKTTVFDLDFALVWIAVAVISKSNGQKHHHIEGKLCAMSLSMARYVCKQSCDMVRTGSSACLAIYFTILILKDTFHTHGVYRALSTS